MIHLNTNFPVRHEYAGEDETSLESLDNDSRGGLFINDREMDILKISIPSMRRDQVLFSPCLPSMGSRCERRSNKSYIEWILFCIRKEYSRKCKIA